MANGIMYQPLIEAASSKYITPIGSDPTVVPAGTAPSYPSGIATPVVTPLDLDQNIVYDGVTYDRYGRTADAYNTPSLMAPPTDDYIRFRANDFSTKGDLDAPSAPLTASNYLPYAKEGFSLGDGEGFGDYDLSGLSMSDLMTQGLMYNPYSGLNQGAASANIKDEAGGGREGNGPGGSETGESTGSSVSTGDTAAPGSFGKDIADLSAAELGETIGQLGELSNAMDYGAMVPGAFGTFAGVVGSMADVARSAALSAAKADVMGTSVPGTFARDMDVLGGMIGLGPTVADLNDHISNTATAAQIGVLGAIGLEAAQALGVTNAAAQAAVSRSRAEARSSTSDMTSAEAAQAAAAMGISADLGSQLAGQFGYSDPVADFGMDFGLDAPSATEAAATTSDDDGFSDVAAAEAAMGQESEAAEAASTDSESSTTDAAADAASADSESAGASDSDSGGSSSGDGGDGGEGGEGGGNASGSDSDSGGSESGDPSGDGGTGGGAGGNSGADR